MDLTEYTLWLTRELFKEIERLVTDTKVDWDRFMPVIHATLSFTEGEQISVTTTLELEERGVDCRPAGKYTVLVRVKALQGRVQDLVLAVTPDKET